MTNNSNFETAYALIIGISKYKDPRIPELRFTRADAEGMYKLLTDPEKVGLNPDNIKLLIDNDATSFNIKNSISNWLFRNADPDSIVFIYFAGHGGVEEDRLGIEKDKYAKYLLPYDTVFDDLYSSSISNRDFNELLLTISSKKLVIFMDSCYSGGVAEKKARDLKITEDPYEKLGEGEGRIVIAASKPDQRSFEDSSLGHGIFTYNLIEALSGKADKIGKGYVTVFDARQYLQEKVPVMAKKLASGDQNPVFHGAVTTDFAISIDRTRIKELEKEKALEEKLKKLREFYRSGRFSGTLLNKLNTVAEADFDTLENKDKDLAKLINDLIYNYITIELFLENLKDIVPELLETKPEEYKPVEKKLNKPDKPEKSQKFEKIEEVLEIKGKIFNQNTGSPLDNVTISYKLDSEIKNIVSDEKGLFSFNAPHKYLDQYIEYEATRIGYQTRKGRYQIKDKRDKVQLEINLAPEEEKKISNISTIISSIPVQGKIAVFIIFVIGIIYLLALWPWPFQTPELSVSPDPTNINMGELNAGENAYQTFSISDSGTSGLIWTVGADKTWIIAHPTNGTNSGKFDIEVNTSGLQPGEHSGTISIKSNGGDKNGTIFINITTPLENWKNPMGMEFIQIPAGSFEMGSPSTETGRFEYEGPLHNVDFKKEFYIGKYEVTQKQWFDVMGNNPSFFKDENQPVEFVTWDDVSKFIKKLNEVERTNKYRLPSEAEWEYAARAGTTTKYYFGDNDSRLNNYAWYNGNSQGKTHPVGQKKPNRWGLYDMNGNVFEWVQDKWIDNYNNVPSDGNAWVGGLLTERVFRGGSLNTVPEYCRSAFRYFFNQSERSHDLGFRLAKDV